MSNNTYSLNAPEISMETRTYRLHGLSELLGSQPSNPDVRTAYLSGKEPEFQSTPPGWEATAKIYEEWSDSLEFLLNSPLGCS